MLIKFRYGLVSVASWYSVFWHHRTQPSRTESDSIWRCRSILSIFNLSRWNFAHYQSVAAVCHRVCRLLDRERRFLRQFRFQIHISEFTKGRCPMSTPVPTTTTAPAAATTNTKPASLKAVTSFGKLDPNMLVNTALHIAKGVGGDPVHFPNPPV